LQGFGQCVQFSRLRCDAGFDGVDRLLFEADQLAQRLLAEIARLARGG